MGGDSVEPHLHPPGWRAARFVWAPVAVEVKVRLRWRRACRWRSARFALVGVRVCESPCVRPVRHTSHDA